MGRRASPASRAGSPGPSCPLAGAVALPIGHRRGRGGVRREGRRSGILTRKPEPSRRSGAGAGRCGRRAAAAPSPSSGCAARRASSAELVAEITTGTRTATGSQTVRARLGAGPVSGAAETVGGAPPPRRAGRRRRGRRWTGSSRGAAGGRTGERLAEPSVRVAATTDRMREPSRQRALDSVDRAARRSPAGSPTRATTMLARMQATVLSLEGLVARTAEIAGDSSAAGGVDRLRGPARERCPTTSTGCGRGLAEADGGLPPGARMAEPDLRRWDAATGVP